MKNLDFEWLTDEFMLYCRSIQLLKTSQPSLCTGSFDTKTHRLISVQAVAVSVRLFKGASGV